MYQTDRKNGDIPKPPKKELRDVLGMPKKDRVPSSSFSRWLRRRLLWWWALLASSSSPPPKMDAAMPLMPPPTPAAEREERCRERERERDLLRERSRWWCEWRLLRCDLDRFECEVRAEMTDAASSRRPMSAAVSGFWSGCDARRLLQVFGGVVQRWIERPCGCARLGPSQCSLAAVD